MPSRLIWVLESDPSCTYLNEQRETEMRQRILDQIAKEEPIIILPPGRRLVAIEQEQLIQAVRPK